MAVNHSEYSDNYLAGILERVKTIALVGASPKPWRASHEVMIYMQENGYRVIPVNPGLAGTKLLGEKVYASILDVPDAIDMVEIFRRSEMVAEVCEEALKIKTQAVWMQIGVIDMDAARKVEKAGLQVVMDRCPKQDLPRLKALGLL